MARWSEWPKVTQLFNSKNLKLGTDQNIFNLSSEKKMRKSNPFLYGCVKKCMLPGKRSISNISPLQTLLLETVP